MRIQHNLQSMNSNRQLGITTAESAKSSEKLSSGYKINRAADDAAGLSISEKMRRQIRGLGRGSDNSQDGISMVQIADGAMAEIHDMLHRGTELSIQAANGTMSYDDRLACQREIEQIIQEIDAIQERTYFNEIPVLKGGTYYYKHQMIDPGYRAGDLIVGGGQLPSWLSRSIDYSSRNGGIMGSSYTHTNADGTQTGPHAATFIDFANFTPDKIDSLDGKGFHSTCCTCQDRYSIKFDASTNVNSRETSGNHFVYTIGISDCQTPEDIIQKIISGTQNGHPENHFTQYEQQGTKLVIYDNRPGQKPNKSAQSGIFGQGVAQIATENKDPVYAWRYGAQNKQANVHAGTEADMNNKIFIKLPSISSKALNITDVNVSAVEDWAGKTTVITAEGDMIKYSELEPGERPAKYVLGPDSNETYDEYLSRKQKENICEGARLGIQRFGEALEYVSAERSRMGAYQNRLEHTIRNLDNVVENTTAAESRLRDTDIAKEMVKKSMQNILTQAGQSMLAQANQTTQGVMALLQQ
ncbi:flagellin N-terminal helical domain-containing protein [Butyrivibrio sp. AE3006]|uniref:flagellin N-terminal helical domain-containing protein n=1 Tax=Butyrivibrio sp. AE3006 TaxID=1280673 RepID=UPI001FA6ADE6|nr:flagellin [Butyrivibrio sp. AE3006]